ncbi:OLC1v1004303C1 [Oldenlandia corymbosa var. corymbosa]|uniref:OLC1v1004303C1 n=1 Tax=Oldenlandia corymbosa var. corymbosa TaxID=529605 RepID=A0AAV1DF02_OLDCO|nr:OLC1v1004303C1 [Oldenlandia corymbosa var. corymbosa]
MRGHDPQGPVRFHGFHAAGAPQKNDPGDNFRAGQLHGVRGQGLVPELQPDQEEVPEPGPAGPAGPGRLPRAPGRHQASAPGRRVGPLIQQDRGPALHGLADPLQRRDDEPVHLSRRLRLLREEVPPEVHRRKAPEDFPPRQQFPGNAEEIQAAETHQETRLRRRGGRRPSVGVRRSDGERRVSDLVEKERQAVVTGAGEPDPVQRDGGSRQKRKFHYH